MRKWIVLSLLCGMTGQAFALEAACEPLIKGSKAKMAQPAWHSIVEGEGVKIEAIKVDGKFYMNQGDKWQKSPMNLDIAEEMSIKAMEDGDFKVTNCQEEGSETIEGVETIILGYDSEIPGTDLGVVSVKVYLGKEDNLPYLSTSDNTKSTYRYSNITAPKL